MIRRLLITNRGEIAVRIIRSAADMRIGTVAVAAKDDDEMAHARLADETRVLPLSGPAAFLDQDHLVRVAMEAGCDALHPGYGFLSEAAEFSDACDRVGVVFVGPTPDQLRTLGDKSRARALAQQLGIPVPDGTPAGVTLAEAAEFLASVNAPVMVKAVAGGGGRGIRLVRTADELEAAFRACQSEAGRSFGDDRVFIERAVQAARHIEVQVIGDGTGAVMTLGDRDCTLQRRRQKLIEIAPSPHLTTDLRNAVHGAARRMAMELGYRNVGTFEFIVDHDGDWRFLEANPRLQVEHTITEELFGVDLVRIQLQLAGGTELVELGLDAAEARKGFVIEARVNLETMTADGAPVPQAGVIRTFEPPMGPAVRVDTHAFSGYRTTMAYDSLLAKVIVTSASPLLSDGLAKTSRALTELRVSGVATNVDFLRAILDHPGVADAEMTTTFVDDHMAALVSATASITAQRRAERRDALTGIVADDNAGSGVDVAEGSIPIRAPSTGMVTRVLIAEGDAVQSGRELIVVEAMKMEQALTAPCDGRITWLGAREGDSTIEGRVLAVVLPDGGVELASQRGAHVDLEHMRADLREVLERHADLTDERRAEAVERRRLKFSLTARENLAALCDAGTFREYGGLTVAAQRRRRSLPDLIRKTPGDGVLAGFGRINGTQFDDSAEACFIIFDETVLAGTMGEMGRIKLKRVVRVAHDERRSVVLYAEGGGGRAGDTDGNVDVTGWTLDVTIYHQVSQLSGLVPLVGVTHGRCFAANAGVLACCDVIIATKDSNIGVGGPSMVEFGRLGTYAAEDIGPIDVQGPNGVVDIVVDDEGEAAAVAKKYLGYFQGDLTEWTCEDQRAARHAIPENRLRAYEVRRVIEIIADVGSVLELRRQFGVGMVTSLIRVEGKPMGVIANNPLHLGGSIDSDAADKASRFMRLCEAFDVPILMLCDTPGVMVGPEAERSATVRKMGRMFVTGANLTVPFFTVVLRKAYGIGAELMAGGWFRAPRFTVSWPTGEFGGMNIEGNVLLAHSAELAALPDPVERQAQFDRWVAELYDVGRAMSVATHYEVDDVIDPATTRSLITGALRSHHPDRRRATKRLPYVDPW